VKGIILLADYFEDTEAITTIDILRRAEIKIDLVSLCEKTLKTQTGLNIEADFLFTDVDYKDYDFLVIPGGKAVFKTLVNLKVIDEVIKDFNGKGKLIATICAAPYLPGRLGLFKDGKYTCFPGCDEGVEGKNTRKGVTVYKNLITGKSMAYTVDFALAIVEYLEGLVKSKKIDNQIHGE